MWVEGWVWVGLYMVKVHTCEIEKSYTNLKPNPIDRDPAIMTIMIFWPRVTSTIKSTMTLIIDQQ